MALESFSNGKVVNLLTLPKSDLVGSSNHHPPSSSDTRAGTSSGSEETLLLMQLPLGWSVHDLYDSHFVGSCKNQTALVSNSKEESFSLVHVETSNCLVMIPPTDDAATPLDDDDDDDDSESPHKKHKSLRAVPSRILKRGGSGASFLELQPKRLSLASLKQALETWDPYSNTPDNPKGRSVESLAYELQQSNSQIQKGLEKLQRYVYPLPSSLHTKMYCLLSEELRMAVHSAIVSTLMEETDFQDYANEGVIVQTFVQSTVERMSDQERFEGVDGVVRHLLMELAGKQTRSKDTIVKPEVEKVARLVASRLLMAQTEPWEEHLLLARWQTELPGVGRSYQVSTSMLRGLAIPVTDESNELFWMFLGTDHLLESRNNETCASSSTLAERAFETLFQRKDRKWTLDELQPYLDVIEDATGTSQSDLLARHTKSTTEIIDSVPVKVFQRW